MIQGTIALPIWNSQNILWLCLESLCRQYKPVEGWELICFEEKYKFQVGESYIKTFQARLKEVGCEKIVYLSSGDKVPLSMKWVKIAKASSPRGLCEPGDRDQDPSKNSYRGRSHAWDGLCCCKECSTL
jgi:hypothetical protein